MKRAAEGVAALAAYFCLTVIGAWPLIASGQGTKYKAVPPWAWEKK